MSSLRKIANLNQRTYGERPQNEICPTLNHFFQNKFDRIIRAQNIPETIKRLCSCQPVSLDHYRLINEKLELLDSAIVTLDRDVIIYIVLFLKKSLSNSCFHEILFFKSSAANAYISYLRESGDPEELIDFLYGIGNKDEAAMVEFMLASKKQQPDDELKKPSEDSKGSEFKPKLVKKSTTTIATVYKWIYDRKK